jgi:hypothetical protein
MRYTPIIKIISLAALVACLNLYTTSAQAAVSSIKSAPVAVWWWIPYYIPHEKPFDPADDPCWREPGKPAPKPNPYECPDHGPHTIPVKPVQPTEPCPVPDGFPADPCDH